MYSKVWSRLDWFFDYIGEPNTEIYGCTDTNADNYNSDATLPCDNCCEYWGCTDPLADNYDSDANVDDDSCFYSYGNAEFSFGSISSDSIEVIMSNDVPVQGFQFTLTDNPDLFTISAASGGAADAAGFTVSTSASGIVVGFSLAGTTIPVGNAVLTNLNYMENNSGTAELCIQDIVVSDQNANPLSTNLAVCDTIEITDLIPGDMNYDDITNVLDVIILVNMALGNTEADLNGDMNGDGVINILDVVILVGIILE